MGFGDLVNQLTCLSLTLPYYLSGKAGSKCTIGGINLPAAWTTYSTVGGFEDTHGNSVFLGIPYAATTGGDNRCVLLGPYFETLVGWLCNRFANIF